MSNAAQAKPTRGEMSSERKYVPACPQSTPLVPVFTAMSWLAMPTPMIEPISVCELDAGRPSHQVPRFHKIAETSRANTIAKPAPRPTCRYQFDRQQRHDGESHRAGGEEHANQIPDAGPDHGDVRLERMRINHRGHGVGRVVEPVHKFKCQGDQQRDTQEHIGPRRGDMHPGEIGHDANADEDDPADKHEPEESTSRGDPGDDLFSF